MTAKKRPGLLFYVGVYIVLVVWPWPYKLGTWVAVSIFGAENPSSARTNTGVAFMVVWFLPMTVSLLTHILNKLTTTPDRRWRRCLFWATSTPEELDRLWADGLSKQVAAQDDVRWVAKATNLWVLAADTRILIRSRDTPQGRWRAIKLDTVTAVDVRKHWLDWGIDIYHAGDTTRCNTGGDRDTAQRIADWYADDCLSVRGDGVSSV